MILLTMYNNTQSRIAKVILDSLNIELQIRLVDPEIEDNPAEPELLCEQEEVGWRGCGRSLHLRKRSDLSEQSLGARSRRCRIRRPGPVRGAPGQRDLSSRKRQRLDGYYVRCDG